jgi:hypothetical protein
MISENGNYNHDDDEEEKEDDEEKEEEDDEEEKEEDDEEEKEDDEEEEKDDEEEEKDDEETEEKDEEDKNIFDIEINEQHLINLISEDIINSNKIKNHMQVLFANYKFENFNLIIKFRSADRSSIFIGVDIEDLYKKNLYDDNNYHHPEYAFKQIFPSIRDAIAFLYLQFRKDYSYSKITDRIEKKKDLIRQEQKEISYLMFSQNSLFDEIKSNYNCCVCFEPNFVMTKCNHNLCRKCFIKIEKKKCNQCDDETYCAFPLRRYCPMCRGFL